MNFRFLILALLFLTAVIQAQQPYQAVDMEEVGKRFSGPSGRMAYEQLSSRMTRGEVLNEQDYRNLYYGSAFQEGHETRDQVNARDLATMLAPGKTGVLVARCDSILAIRPVDLAGNYFKGLGLFLQDTMSLEATSYRAHYAMLVEAILSTGNGAGCGSAFQVLGEQDALETMRFLGIPGFTGEVREENCQVFRIRASPIYNARRIYFDMTHAAPAFELQTQDSGGGKKRRD